MSSLQGCSSEECQLHLSANAVSLAYEKIRSVIEMVTAESPVGKQILPTIAPYNFLEALKSKSVQND